MDNWQDYVKIEPPKKKDFGEFGEPTTANLPIQIGHSIVIDGHVKGKKDGQSKKFIENYSRRTPLGRLAKTEEIAPAVAFLASDASSYITGTNLIIDGGWTSI